MQVRYNTNGSDNGHVMNVLGTVLTNDNLIETVWNPKTGDTKLIVWKENSEEIQELPEYISAGNVYRPLVDENVKCGRVLLTPDYSKEVDRKQLLQDIKDHINEHVEMDPRYVEVSARYTMMTWVYDRFHKIPYLRILGPWGTGKSRYLEVVGGLCYHRSLLGEGITQANIYRWMARYPGTLLLDEADFANTKDGLLVQILNGGYSREGVVIRSERTGRGYTPVPYKTFGPKILATNTHYENDSLESRFLTIYAKKLTRSDISAYLPPALSWDKVTELRNRLLGFRYKYFFKINPEDKISGLDSAEPRLAEIIKPLLQILGEGELSAEMKSYIEQDTDERRNNLALGDDGMVVEALFDAWPTNGGTRPYVGEIAERVNARRKYDYLLSDRKVGAIIRKVGLKTERTGPGFVVVATIDQLESLARRYGIVRPKPGDN